MTRIILFLLSMMILNESVAQKKDSIMNIQEATLNKPDSLDGFHRQLNLMTGEWQYTGKFWPEGHEHEPSIDKGEAFIKWVNDNRFLLFEGTGTQMNSAFSFISLIGYNAIRKKFYSVWADNSTSAMFITSGSFNDDETKIIFYGQSDDPFSGEFDKQWKIVLTFENHQAFRFDYLDISKGDELQLFEFRFSKTGKTNN